MKLFPLTSYLRSAIKAHTVTRVDVIDARRRDRTFLRVVSSLITGSQSNRPRSVNARRRFARVNFARRAPLATIRSVRSRAPRVATRACTMRRALGELDQNTPIATRRSPRQCVANARDETPVRTRDAADDEGGTPASARRRNAAALDVAEALVRENWQENRSRYAKNHMTYAEALKQSGYVGDNGVAILCRRVGAARRQGDVDAAVDAVVDALVGVPPSSSAASRVRTGVSSRT